jgi:hypothetical protein
MMPHGSYSLGEIAAKEKMVRLVCDKCGRRGQYRIDRLHLPQGNVNKTETMPHGYPDWGRHTGNG